MSTFMRSDFSGSTTLTDESIRNHFKRDLSPWEPIAELVWNGLDAGARNIAIEVEETEAHGTAKVTISDDGHGIDFTRPLDNFRRFNDSLKKKSHALHGSKGRGRLAFHKICRNAAWLTKYEGQNAVIKIDSSSLKDIVGRTIPNEEQHHKLRELASGTVVELANFFKNLPDTETLSRELSLEFGWHLALNPTKSISLNGQFIVPPEHTKISTKVFVSSETFDVSLIQWKEKLKTEKSYTYVLDSSGMTVYHTPSSLNYKPGYYTSLSVASDWFDAYSPQADLTFDTQSLIQSKIWRDVAKKINEFAQEQYRAFLITLADQQIEEFEQEGDFPDYSGFEASYSQWRLKHTKDILRTIIVCDPKLLKNSNKRQRRIIIRLLDKISVSNENDALLDVLEGVLGLDANSMNQFASQIQKAKLNNIIQTIETLQKREQAINRIAEIIRNHYKETLETPDLQGIIENNTWLFGSQYETIGAEEDTFTKIAVSLRNKVKGDEVDEEDLEDGATINGANRQVDLFLVRRIMQFDSNNQPFYRCVIIEIKRPSISLNKKHLRQMEDYAGILSRHPEFSGARTRYEIILVGRKISDADYDIRARLADMADKNDPGLVGSGPIKRYVKTWRTIIEEFQLSNEYLLGVLKTQRENLENESRQDLLKALHSPTQ